eukprot:747564-Hanusia_phi.AAC.6
MGRLPGPVGVGRKGGGWSSQKGSLPIGLRGETMGMGCIWRYKGGWGWPHSSSCGRHAGIRSETGRTIGSKLERVKLPAGPPLARHGPGIPATMTRAPGPASLAEGLRGPGVTVAPPRRRPEPRPARVRSWHYAIII